MLDEYQEENLIRQAQAGNDGAFGALVEAFLPNAYSFLARMTDADTAEDLAQETFVKAWKNIRRFDAAKRFKPWLLTIAKNTAYDHLRKKRTKPFSEFEDSEGGNPLVESLADASEPLADEAAIAKESAAVLGRAVTAIPLLYRAVLLLRLEENLEFEEIAALTGKPIETIRSQYRRGLSLLKKSLGKK